MSTTIAMQTIYFIRAEWDDVAEVWVATSDDVPGLVTEASSLEALTTKLKGLIPELLEANSVAGDGEIFFDVLARRFGIAERVSA